MSDVCTIAGVRVDCTDAVIYVAGRSKSALILHEAASGRNVMVVTPL